MVLFSVAVVRYATHKPSEAHHKLWARRLALTWKEKSDNNPSVDDKATKRSTGSPVLVLAILVMVALLPLLYVLSVGPVIWLANRGVIPQSWFPTIETVYFDPMMWAAEKSPVVGETYGMYLELWTMPNQGAAAAPPVVATPAVATPTAASTPAPAVVGP